MILGRGSARSDKAILAEYQQFVAQHHSADSELKRHGLLRAPQAMRQHLGRPILEWKEDELLGLLTDKAWFWQRQEYRAFAAFLMFRGYFRPSLRFCRAFPTFNGYHDQALLPIQRRIEAVRVKLGHVPRRRTVQRELHMLVLLVVVAHKPLEELTRPDFRAFWDEYQPAFRARQAHSGLNNGYLTRVESYLMEWDILPPRSGVYRHERDLAQLPPGPILSGLKLFFQWLQAKYGRATLKCRRDAVLRFFLWFRKQQPARQRLDAVTRPMVLAYANHLKGQNYSIVYFNNLYRGPHMFYEFAIDERLPSAPGRNPFSLSDLPRRPAPLPRYLDDREIRQVLAYCEQGASLKERTLVITLFHTGIRAAELANLKVSDIVQVGGHWKLHIREGKGMKDRVIPLTSLCRETLERWQAEGWERANDYLFTYCGRRWAASAVTNNIRKLGAKLGLRGMTPHRFRHTFAVALLNYGVREAALQKLMGHGSLDMTLVYARILDRTVEQAFNTAVEQMHTGPVSWVPSFFAAEDYDLFTEGDTVSWIRLPHGYCRRNPKLHCESDVKCLLCDRFVASAEDMPRFREMHERFQALGLDVKAEVVAAQIRRLEAGQGQGFIPVNEVFINGARPDRTAQTVVPA
jgi:integrase/recombinase XerC